MDQTGRLLQWPKSAQRQLALNPISNGLAAQPVRAEINGEVRGAGSGAAVLGHPLNALLWLANALNARGMHLRAGDLVTTGVTTNVFMAESGDHIRADFGSVGSVELIFA